MDKFKKNQEKFSKGLEAFKKEVLLDLIPNIRFASAGGIYPPDGPMDHFSAKIASGKNEILDNSRFEYNGNYNFIHFTSLKSATEILKSKTIRMYDLGSMSDKYELLLSVQNVENKEVFSLDKSIDLLRENTHVFSMCEYDNTMIDTDPYLWDRFGLNGNGVAVHFELDNPRNSKNWHNEYFLGKIDYRNIEDAKSERVELLERYDDYKKKYGITCSNLNTIVSVFYSFIKGLPYKDENEVCLLRYADKRNHEYQFHEDNTIFPEINKHGKLGYYTELPLNTEDNMLPKIQIKEIILGYNITDIIKLTRFFNFFDNNIKVRQTKLSQYFL